MPSSDEKTLMLDLSQSGAFVEFDVRRFSSYSVEAIGNDRWGSAVAEIKLVVGHQARGYTVAKTLDTSTSRHNNIACDQDSTVRVAVTTPDATKGFARIVVFGKETQ